jgi:hypothetical protein
MTAARAVFTALLGGYEELNEQPIAAESGVPFICFTDDPRLASETWQIIPVEPLLPLDLVRSQRDLKIRGHRDLDEFEETLYIDNSVLLLKTPEDILDDWLAEADYAVSLHSYRERVIDEFDEVVALNYDDAGRVHEQLLHYSDLYPELIHQHPYWNGIIARRRTLAVDAAMQLWFDHVLRFSRRDQLSANVALGLSEVHVNPIPIDNFESELHRWPVDVKRKISLGKNSTRNTGPILAEVARLKREVMDLTEKLEREQAERADDRRDAVRTNEALDDALRRVDEEGERVRAQMQAQLDQVLLSRSWKISAPVRWAGRVGHKVRPGGQSN